MAQGAYPSPLNYHGYPKSLCTSVNEVICHGIPDSRPLGNGDIVNLDVTVYLEGVHGDTNATFGVGSVDAESQRLVAVTRECLDRAIESVRPGRPISDMGGRSSGTPRKRDSAWCATTAATRIGEVFHSAPQISPLLRTFGRHRHGTGRGTSPDRDHDHRRILAALDVGRRLDCCCTPDGRRTAQFEHTILVTETGADVLTRAE